MFEYVTAIGSAVLVNIIQLAAGCVLGIAAALFLKKHQYCNTKNRLIDSLIILLTTLSGILLPLGPFGIIPLAAGLYYAGFRLQHIVPMFLSGLIFNIAVPFSEPAFVWKTGIIRLILSVTAGLISGWILILLENRQDHMHRFGEYKLPVTEGFAKNIIHAIPEAINRLGIYLLLGTIAEPFFRDYFLYRFPGWIFQNKYGSQLPVILSHYGITNPFFSTAVQVFYAIVNLTGFAALLSVFKPKGLAYIYGLLAGFIAILALTAFI